MAVDRKTYFFLWAVLLAFIPANNMSTGTTILDLPKELLEHIFAKLGIRDVFRTERTCKKWKKLIWSSQIDIILPYYNTQYQRGKAVSAASHKILTTVDPVKIRRLDLFSIHYELNEQDIEVLKKMKSLSYLMIEFSSAMMQERFSFIPYLTNIRHLSLITTPMEECIDAVGSAPMPHLTSLTILQRPLSNLSPLLNLTRVKAIDLRHCQLLDKTGVIALFTSMTQLDTLNIMYVRGIESENVFGSLSCLTNLTDLSFSSGPVPSLLGNMFSEKEVLNKVLSALSKLKSLDMNYLSAYNDATIRIISNMSDLTKLVIFFTEFTPAKTLSKLTNMQHLIVSASTEKRQSDKFYSVMTNLTSLQIPMSNSDFSHFEHLTCLKCLTINNRYQIDDSFYPYVMKMTQLEHLDFQRSRFSVMKLGKFASLRFLTHLDVKGISCVNIADIIQPLTRFTNLRSLHTPCAWSVDWLLKLTNLEQLEISLTQHFN